MRIDWSGWRGQSGPENRAAFTLLELLVVTAVVATLAGLLLPALARAQKSAQRVACVSNLHQQAILWQSWLADNEDRFPDRRDLKNSLPGGYKPWATWPKSDPRTGWAPVVLDEAARPSDIWNCPAAIRQSFGNVEQSVQQSGSASNATAVRYWMWRFDRRDDPVPDDNFWGRTPEDCVTALQRSGNPTVGNPVGPQDVELMVDIYFPATITSLPTELRGRSPHRGGRNRLMLDSSVDFARDSRTSLD